MRRTSLASAVLLVAATGAVWISTSVAAPILFEPDVPDELRCLAGIHDVSVELDPDSSIPPNVKPHELQALVISILNENGFRVREGRNTPRMVLYYLLVRNEKVPGVFALTTSLAIQQHVRLHRLEIDLTLPVGTIATTAISQEQDLAELYTHQTKTTAEDFVHFVKTAAAAAKIPRSGEGL